MINFIAQHRWKGCVTKVKEKTFSATLTNENEDEFVAEFNIDDVSEDDKELIQENNIFYWSIGYLNIKNNQKLNAEKIIFKRLPDLKKLDINNNEVYTEF